MHLPVDRYHWENSQHVFKGPQNMCFHQNLAIEKFHDSLEYMRLQSEHLVILVIAGTDGQYMTELILYKVSTGTDWNCYILLVGLMTRPGAI